MPENCYDGACGGTITERWYGDMQDVSCNRGYGMQTEGARILKNYAEDAPWQKATSKTICKPFVTGAGWYVQSNCCWRERL